VNNLLGEWRPDDVLLVNLDANRLHWGACEQPIKIPPRQRRKLLDSLQQIVADYDAGKAREQMAAMELAFSMAPTPAESDSVTHQDMAMNPDLTAQVQYAFFRLFLSLLRNYTEYLVRPSAHEPDPPELLRKCAFIQAAPKEARRFLSAFLETQMLNVFLEKRVYAESAGEHDLHVLFDESLLAKENRSALRLHKRATPFLDETRFAVTRTHISLAPNEVQFEFECHKRSRYQILEWFVTSSLHQVLEWFMTASLMQEGLAPGGVQPFVNFPKLNAALFCKPREVRSLISGNLLHHTSEVGTKNGGGWRLGFSTSHSGGMLSMLEKEFAPAAQSGRSRLGAVKNKGQGADALMRETIYAIWFWLNMVLIAELQGEREREREREKQRAAAPSNASTSSSSKNPTASSPPPPPARGGVPEMLGDEGGHGGGGEGGRAVAQDPRGQMEVALQVLGQMRAEKLSVDEGVYRVLLETCGRAGCHEQAVALLEEMQGQGVRPDVWVYGR
jgi:pentatricopeptide repeat protein